MRNAALVLLLALAPACASSPSSRAPAPAAFDGTGTFDFTTQVSGSTVRGVLVIARGADGTHGGSVTTDATGSAPIRDVEVGDRSIRVTVTAPDGTAVLELNFSDDNEFTGYWSYAGLSGALSGRRRTG
jgi:hypothetical protein